MSSLELCYKEIDVEELANIGWIQITSIGDENMYFTLEDGTRCFAKVDGYAWQSRSDES